MHRCWYVCPSERQRGIARRYVHTSIWFASMLWVDGGEFLSRTNHLFFMQVHVNLVWGAWCSDRVNPFNSLHGAGTYHSEPMISFCSMQRSKSFILCTPKMTSAQNVRNDEKKGLLARCGDFERGFQWEFLYEGDLPEKQSFSTLHQQASF
jgi:hypothetical protein